MPEVYVAQVAGARASRRKRFICDVRVEREGLGLGREMLVGPACETPAFGIETENQR